MIAFLTGLTIAAAMLALSLTVALVVVAVIIQIERMLG